MRHPSKTVNSPRRSGRACTLSGMDTEPIPRYRGLRLSVRPMRLAVAIEGGDGWPDRYWAALAAVSDAWGGAGSVLITGERMVPWQLAMLRAFDPDSIGRFLERQSAAFPTELDREGREAWIGAQARAVRLKFPEIDEDQAMRYGRDALQQVRRDWRPSEVFERMARERLSFVGRVGSITVENADSVAYGMSAVAEISRGEDTPPLEYIETSGLDPFLRVLVGMRVGAVTPDRWDSEQLRLVDQTPIGHRVDKHNLKWLFEYLWTGAIDDSSLHLAQLLAANLGVPGDEAPWARTAFQANTPMARSMEGLVSIRPLRHDPAPLTIVIGNTADDFSYAMMRDRLDLSGVWIPAAWMGRRNKLQRTAVGVLVSLIYSYLVHGADRRVILTSASLERASLARYLGQLRSLMFSYQDRIGIVPIEEIAIPAASGQMWVDESMWDRHVGSSWSGPDQVDPIETPIPTAVRPQASHQLHWFVDVGITGYQPPLRQALNDILAVGAGGRLADETYRPSKWGLTYRAQAIFVAAGQSLDRMAIRPRLRTPEALEVFRRIAAEVEMELVPSDKGAYFMAAQALWGGFGPMSADITDGRKAALFDAFHVGRDMDRPGFFLAWSSRRYLSAEDCGSVTRMPDAELALWLDQLHDSRILSRGLLLRCPTCRLLAWYRPSQADRDFSCARCRTTSPVNSARWVGDSKGPTWFYELAEVVHQATAGDFRTICVVLKDYQAQSTAFDFAPQLDVHRGDTKLCELDIWAIVDGRLVIGEAKSNDRLEKTEAQERQLLNRLVQVARAITADELVVATSANSWRETTRALIKDKLSDPYINTRVLSGVGT